jgi:peptidylprolyl isomerase
VKHLALIAGLGLALALVACGGSGSGGQSDKPTRPEIEPPSDPPTELVIEDLELGSGPRAEQGDKVTVHYEGIDMDGKTLYSSWRNGSVFIFELGRWDYGEGFEEGIEGMRVGGRRELQVPKDLAPFESPVIYVVDLLKVEKGDSPRARKASSGSDSTASASRAKPSIEVPSEPPAELVIEDVVEGAGPVARSGDEVEIQYLAVDKAGKEIFSSSWRKSNPFSFTLGDNALKFKTFEKSLEGVKAGGRRELRIPGDLAFGEDLYYVVDLLKVEKQPAAAGKGG